MDRAAELRKIYEEALVLSERQGQAIEQENWTLLQTLLEMRERCILRAEQLLTQPVPPEKKAELTERLQQLHRIDDRNQQLLDSKHKALQAEMESLGRSKTALNGYLGSFGDVMDPSFFDQDR